MEHQNGKLTSALIRKQNLILIIIYITNILIFDTSLFPRRPSAPTAFYNIHKVFLLRSLSSYWALTHDPYLPHISVETCYFRVAWKNWAFVCASACVFSSPVLRVPDKGAVHNVNRCSLYSQWFTLNLESIIKMTDSSSAKVFDSTLTPANCVLF